MLTKKQRRIVRKLQSNLYARVHYMTDQEKHGRLDYWEQVPKDFRKVKYLHGDCELYARIACQELRAEGLEARLVYCTVESNGGAHLICVCGGQLLDNRFARTRTVNQARRYGYKMIAMSGKNKGDDWHFLEQN